MSYRDESDESQSRLNRSITSQREEETDSGCGGHRSGDPYHHPLVSGGREDPADGRSSTGRARTPKPVDVDVRRLTSLAGIPCAGH